MKIAIDLSPLQSPHRMRGIGYTLINFINNIPEGERKQHRFVFFISDLKRSYFSSDPLELLDLDGISYETRPIGYHEHHVIGRHSNLRNLLRILKVFKASRQYVQRHLPHKAQHTLNRFGTLYRDLRSYYRGDSRIQDLSDIDVYLQTDQSQSLPAKHGLKKVMIAYDLIPYLLERDYLWSYRTARQNGLSRLAAFERKFKRSLYAHKLRLNTLKANKIIAISQLTKDDFIRHLSVSENKIDVIPLGVSKPSAHNKNDFIPQQYKVTSWGPMKFPLDVDSTDQFLLFVGGADKRRRLEDLVAAFNIVRAQGYKVKLVLAGDIMLSPDAITTPEVRNALRESSYLDDVIFMGFVDDKTRDWLYGHALAFMFPSRYEGFGLPVLEAMSYGCPVISYPNRATVEVANDAPIYAENILEISRAIKSLLDDPTVASRMSEAGIEQAKDFSWSKTSAQIIDALKT